MLEPEWGQTEPPGIKPVKGSPLVKLLVTAALVIALSAAAFLIPIPVFYAYLPGPVRDVERLVDVGDERTYSSEGSLLLTTVSVDPQVTFWEVVKAAFDDATAIVAKEDVTGGKTLDELIEDQKIEMRDSKQAAEEVALTALGFSEPTGDGARVIETIEDTPADGVLEIDDVIVSVEGRPVDTTCDVGRAIDQFEVGDTIEVGVKRDGRVESFDLEVARDPRDARAGIIGVFMEDVNRQFESNLDITIETGKIGGPSGGLMMTLALYDQLTPDDLTGGRKVAGTGTIGCDGGVGPIGGIEQKVAGAEEAGATIFLSPSANAEAAKSVADEIEIVTVSTFDQAVAYLEGLPQS